MKDGQKVLQCLYCGNSTLMDLVGQHKYDWDEGDGYYGYFLYQMFACPVCGRVTFHQRYWDVAQSHYCGNGKEETNIDEEILYPINKFQTTLLPKDVKEAYEAALKTRNIDSAVCLIALRRTLEIICKEKNAAGRDLWHKIEDLSTRGVLPKELKHASNITKKYGNMGAHDAAIKVSASELNQIIEFVQYILDYLYVLPSKLNEIQTKMEKALPENEEG